MSILSGVHFRVKYNYPVTCIPKKESPFIKKKSRQQIVTIKLKNIGLISYMNRFI